VRRITLSGVMQVVIDGDALGIRPAGVLTPASSSSHVDRVAVAEDGTIYVSGRFHLPHELNGPQFLIAIDSDGTISSVPIVEGDSPWTPCIVDLAIGPSGAPLYTVDYFGSQDFSFGGSWDIVGGGAQFGQLRHEAETGRFAIAPDGSVVVGTYQAAWRRISPEGHSTTIPGLTDYVLRSDAIAVGPDDSIYWTDVTSHWRMGTDLAINRIAAGRVRDTTGDGGPRCRRAAFQR
jgi:hypothetical protein